MNVSWMMRWAGAITVLGVALAACGASPTTQQPTSAATSASAPTAAATPAPTAMQPTTSTEVPTAAASSPQATAGTQEETPLAGQPTPTFAAPTADTLAVAQAAQAEVQKTSDTPVVAGTVGIEGDYAAAVAQPLGQRTQYVFLRRNGAAWDVLLATSIPSSEALKELGVPESLTLTSETGAVLDAWMAQLQDAQGQGVEGSLVIEGIAGDYARGIFSPADPTTQEGITAFFKREGDSWEQLTAGTAFDEATLQQLGIPQELWTAP